MPCTIISEAMMKALKRKTLIDLVRLQTKMSREKAATGACQARSRLKKNSKTQNQEVHRYFRCLLFFRRGKFPPLKKNGWGESVERDEKK